MRCWFLSLIKLVKMNIEDIAEQIKEKQTELGLLKKQLQEVAKSKYEYLLGKYFQLAGTSYIKVTGIEDCDGSSVTVICLKITGGKYCSGRMEFDDDDYYDLDIRDIDNKNITEVTREKFVEHFYDSFKEVEKVVLSNNG